MMKLIRRVSTAVYALSVLAALSFGTSQAFGRTVNNTCRYDGGTFLGACGAGGDAQCTADCIAANNDPEAIGDCNTGAWPGCCVCFL